MIPERSTLKNSAAGGIMLRRRGSLWVRPVPARRRPQASRYRHGFACANEGGAGQEQATNFEHHHRDQHDPGHPVRKLGETAPATAW